MEDFKRQIARKVSITELQNGSYIRQEGWQSNYVQTPSGDKVSRVNILGTVVSEQQMGQFTIDDGTGKIMIRKFEESQIIPDLEIGQVIMVIGRTREFGNQIYILPEIIKPIQNKIWIQVRLQELQRSSKIIPEEVEQPKEIPTLKEVHEIIKELDAGEGVDIEEVLQKLQHEKSEEIVQKLLREGEIFEISPGKLKSS